MKLKICAFWSQGGCDRGRFCGFAHGEHELWTNRPSADEQLPVCKDFSSGKGCAWPNCKFKHVRLSRSRSPRRREAKASEAKAVPWRVKAEDSHKHQVQKLEEENRDLRRRNGDLEKELDDMTEGDMDLFATLTANGGRIRALEKHLETAQEEVASVRFVNAELTEQVAVLKVKLQQVLLRAKCRYVGNLTNRH